MTTVSGEGSCDRASTRSPKLSSSLKVITFPTAYRHSRRHRQRCVRWPEGRREPRRPRNVSNARKVRTYASHGIFGILSSHHSGSVRLARTYAMKNILSPAYPGAHSCGSDLRPRPAKAVVQLAMASRKRDDQVAIKIRCHRASQSSPP